MLIAHEHPLLLANLISDNTDYNYYISTIASQIPAYYEYAKKDARYKILDCGTFEEGKPMLDDEYLSYIEAIQPDEFIVPDHLFEKDKTIDSAKRWLDIIKEKNIESLPVAVVQGKTLEEQVECYLVLIELFDKVAIPYDLPSTANYDMSLKTLPLLTLPCNGRYDLMKHLLQNELFRTDKKHHFLGIDTPTELVKYKQGELSEYKVSTLIDTIDTSSPILHGLKGIEYNSEYGLLKKNKTMMKELILREDIDTIQEYLILKNVNIFKTLCNY